MAAAMPGSRYCMPIASVFAAARRSGDGNREAAAAEAAASHLTFSVIMGEKSLVEASTTAEAASFSLSYLEEGREASCSLSSVNVTLRADQWHAGTPT